MVVIDIIEESIYRFINPACLSWFVFERKVEE